MPGNRLILCATTRLAQELRSVHNRDQATHGLKLWPTLWTATVSQWLASLAEEALLREAASDAALVLRPLDAFQEALLWERVIRESIPEGAADFFDTAGMADTAAEANTLMNVWGIAPDLQWAAEDTREFLGWRRSFRKLCASLGVVEISRWHEAVLNRVASGQFMLPAEVLFAGFDHLTPQEIRLKQVLAGLGVRTGDWPFGQSRAEQIAVASFPESDSEIAHVASWAAEQLRARPDARLAIVAADIASLRNRLEDALDDVLSPSLIRPARAEAPRRYNFSLGKPLSDHPLVGLALRLISIACQPYGLEQQLLGELLRNPYWSAAEADARALLDATMHGRLDSKVSLGQLLSLARRANSADLMHCISHLEAVEGAARQFRKRLLPSRWARLFGSLAGAAGWPGERALSSHEFQVRQAFLDELARFAALDGLLGEIAAGEARQRVADLCQAAVFQAETIGTPQIQVLGMLEAAGLSFDAMWVMGMTANAWPPPQRPNPLLPAELQRCAGSPNASAQVQLAFAQSIHQRLLHGAAEIHLSYPRMEGSVELRPSPLLASLPPATMIAAVVAVPAAAAWDVPQEDAMAPPLADGELARGGVGLLRAQALCPAWAYYQYRLGARALEEPVDGIDLRDRGDIVHGAMQAFWEATGSSAALSAMDAVARKAALGTAIEAALARFEQATHAGPLKTGFRALEAERLMTLLDTWLRIELGRDAAFEVLSSEQAVILEIDQIVFNMRLDRVDRLSDGSRVLIDYKTGAGVDFSSWGRDRITEPQLPAYAALMNPGSEPIAAVVFARLLFERAGFAGIAAADGLVPGVAGLDSRDGRRLFDADRFADWPALLAHWRDAITRVVREFRSGDAAVRFGDEKELQYCEVRPLLRLAERREQWESLQRQPQT